MPSDAKVVVVDKDHGWLDFKTALEQAGNGLFVDVGLFESEMDPEDIYRKGLVNEMGDAQQNIPERPWLRSTFDENEAGMWTMVVRELRKGPDMDLESLIEDYGPVFEMLLRMKIKHMDSPPNADVTVQKKGFDDPLIETREMINAVSHRFKTANPDTGGE